MEVEQKYGDQVRIIGVPGLGSVDEMQEFLAETDSGTFTHIPDPDSLLWSRFGVLEHRTYVLFNDDGTFGETGYGSLEDDVLDLISR